jgi:hypothetical protein
MYHLLTYEGQMRCNPPPSAHVAFRTQVRRLAFQLLGPPPEQEDAFWRHPDGTPMERPRRENPPEPRQEKPPAKAKRTRK